MTKSLRLLVVLLLAAATSSSLPSQTKSISAADAKNHVGEKMTVCGNVVSAHYSEKTKGQPTFLNFDEPYPKQIFTVVIWGSERGKFGNPEEKYRDKRVCVTGKITEFRGKPEMAATDPTQIEVKK
jgi:hypothetical protein